jgi:cytochrome c oxidase assembly protein subunit 15
LYLALNFAGITNWPFELIVAVWPITSYLQVRQILRLSQARIQTPAPADSHLFYTGWFQLEPSFMPTAAIPIDTKRLPSPGLRRFAWGVLAYFVAVILWGTLVRATGSGAGCGNHWPLCNGTVMQHSASVNTMIEFTHRVTSGLSFFSVVALLWWTFAGTVRAHLARAAALASVVFTLIEAMLGAFLVKLGLTAQSQSPLRPAYLGLHLANTLLLLAALTLTAHLLGRSKGFLRGRIRLVAPFGAIATVVVVLIVGVTGSLAALGDTLFPASSLGMALAQDFSATSGWLVRWRWTHPTVAFVASIFLVWLLVRAAQRSTAWDNRRLSALVLLLLATVYTLGVLDVVLLAPLWVQVAHLLAADSLWAALVVLTARLTIQPREVA